MNILIAGVHGVGKTYLSSQIPADFGLIHTSASRLIKEERSMPSWGTNKLVNDVEGNQIALAAAVNRHNHAGARLLLDGHFVLLNSHGEFAYLDAEVFRSLNLDGVILLEADPLTIAMRVRARDAREENEARLVDFMEAERSQANLVCRELGIPLNVLNDPNITIFIEAVKSLGSCSRNE